MSKTYFISDAHLGSKLMSNKRQHEKNVVSLLNHIQKQGATSIYFMGDMFDFWFEYKHVVPKGHLRFLGKLAELSDAGIELHFFIGNHDIWTFGYLEEEIGMKVHRTHETIVINGKTCYLAHGDGIYTHEKKFKLLRAIFHNQLCQRLFAMLPSTWGMTFGLQWSANNRKKELAQENEYKGEENEPLVKFAKLHESHTHADYYIFGHRHIMLDLMIAKECRVIILGDCIQHFSYACIDTNGELSLHTLTEAE